MLSTSTKKAFSAVASASLILSCSPIPALASTSTPLQPISLSGELTDAPNLGDEYSAASVIQPVSSRAKTEDLLVEDALRAYEARISALNELSGNLGYVSLTDRPLEDALANTFDAAPATLADIYATDNAVSAFAADAPFEADGSKIESISMKWLSGDDFADNSDARLSIRPFASSFSVKAQLDAQLSGQHSYPVGDIQITIPKNIFISRDGRALGTWSFSVPKTPDDRAMFAYSEMSDCFVLVNTKDIPAATSMRFEFSIENINALALNGNINDLSNTDKTKNPTQALSATIDVTTHARNSISRTSNAIDAIVDTQAKVTNASVIVQELSEDWNDSYPASLRPENADDYVYVRWYSYAHVSANQYSSMNFSTSIEDKYDGILLGAKLPGGQVVKADAGARQMGGIELNKEAYNSSSCQYISIYSAYPKKNLPDNLGPYTFYDTVEYELVPKDEPNEKTYASNTVSTQYSPISFPDPVGHFNVFKYGSKTYPYALNRLSKGEAQSARFEVETVGFGLPWTVEHGVTPTSVEDTGKRPYKMITDDYSTRFNHATEDLSSTDFQFSKVEFARPEMYRFERFKTSGYGYHETTLNGGVIAYGPVPAGGYGYVEEHSNSIQPTITLYGKTELADTWIKLADISYVTGSPVIKTYLSGMSVKGSVVNLPDNIADIKCETETAAAGMIYSFYPYVEIKPSASVKAQVASLFDASDIPSTIVRNTAKSSNFEQNEDGSWKHIVNCGPKSADDTFEGVGTSVQLDKDTKYTNDTALRQVMLDYTITATLATNLTAIDDYNMAVDEGLVKTEPSGVFYDLLPLGVEVIPTSISTVRASDKIMDIDYIRNYKDTGRTLLRVVVDENHTATLVKSTDAPLRKNGYGERPAIKFRAYMPWSSVAAYGRRATNYAAYASGNAQIGDVRGFIGEPDDPLYGNHHQSKTAVSGVEAAMTNLAAGTSTMKYKVPAPTGADVLANVIYANDTENFDINTASVTSLFKRVSVNQSGEYGDGLKETSPMNVFEGGIYDYAIEMINDDKSVERDIWFYDDLEGFAPGEKSYPEGNKVPADKGDRKWRGTLIDIDISAMRHKGIDAKIYYSTQEGLVLDEKTAPADRDIEAGLSSGKWKVYSNDMPAAEKAKVRAIAIDATKKTDGSNFELAPSEVIGYKINMHAPTATQLAKKDGFIKGTSTAQEIEFATKRYYDTPLAGGELESADDGFKGGAHAYNNAVMSSTHIDRATGAETPDQLIHHDYTKVGLQENPITVSKKWNDENDNDRYRPAYIDISLMRDGASVGKARLNDDNKWTATFTGLPTFSDDGKQIKYEVAEMLPQNADKYTASVRQFQRSHDGYLIEIENIHKPDETSIKGIKRWSDENNKAGARPDSVFIDVYGDGVYIKTIQVEGTDTTDEWEWEVSGLRKYNQGKEISYSVKERRGDYSHDYYPDKEEYSGDDIVIDNTYEPFGDLAIQKKVSNAVLSDKVKDTEFSFKVELFTDERGDTGELVPDAGTYTAVKYDALGKEIETKEISCGDIVKMRRDEKVIVENIPTSHTWRITEMIDAEGWQNEGEEVLEGALWSGVQEPADFTNRYRARGSFNAQMIKEMKYRRLFPNQFKFELCDEDGNVVRSARNRGDGTVAFSAIEYDENDVGKTYCYTIREVALATTSPAYEMAEGVAEVSVHIEDNGDGTLEAVPVYTVEENNDKWRLLDETEAQERKDASLVGLPVATNIYRAHGELGFKAFKELRGRDLKDGEFSFALHKITEGEGGIETRELVEENVKNTAAGDIDFAPVSFDETDIGHTYIYEISEMKGTDETVVYSDDVVRYSVYVGDLGGGELGFTQRIIGEKVPVIVNTLKPGELEILKTVSNEEGTYDPLAEFIFEVELSGTDVEDGVYDYTLSSYEPPLVAFAVYSEDDKSLCFYKRPETTVPVEGEQFEGKTATGIYTDIEELDADGTKDIPWFDEGYCSVDFVDEIFPISTAYWFSGEMVEGGWDVPRMPSKGALEGCKFNLTKLNTSNVTNMRFMFALSGGAVHCYDGDYSGSIDVIDVSGFDTRQVDDMSYMFSISGALKIEGLDNFDMSNVTKASNMLGCKADLTNTKFEWELNSLQEYDGMFCSEYFIPYAPKLSQLCFKSLPLGLTKLSILLTNDINIFDLKSKTEELICDFDLENINDLSQCFAGWGNLRKLDLSAWDMSGVTNMEYMFHCCYKLVSVDVNKWNTCKVTNMNKMFTDCRSLSSLDLSGWDTRNVINMNYMFNGCDQLKTIFVSDLWTSSAAMPISSMFNYSGALIGGAGTKYDYKHIDGEYARIDNPPDEPGYFTYKAPPVAAQLTSAGSDAPALFSMGDPFEILAVSKSNEVLAMNAAMNQEQNAASVNERGSINEGEPTVQAKENADYSYAKKADVDAGEEVEYTITYDANGGYFGDDPNNTTRTVTYKRDSQVKVAHSRNLDDEGNKIEEWERYQDDEEEIQVVKIPGAEKLIVTLSYQNASVSSNEGTLPNGWISIYDDSIIPNKDNYDRSLTGKLSNIGDTATFEIVGDTVQIFSYCENAWEINNGYLYGYYAHISSAPAEIPEPSMLNTADDLKFAGWKATDDNSILNMYSINESSNDNNTQNLINITTDTTLYAVWTKDVAFGRQGNCSWNINEDKQLIISPIANTDGDLGRSPIAVNNDRGILIADYCSKWNYFEYTNVISYEKVYTKSFKDFCAMYPKAPLFATVQNEYITSLVGNRALVSATCNWDTSEISSFSYMFYNCISLTKLDIKSWNTSRAVEAERMFGSCYALTELTLGENFTINPFDSLPTNQNPQMYTDNWIKYDKNGNIAIEPISQSELDTAWDTMSPADRAGTWHREYQPGTTVKLKANGGAGLSNSMYWFKNDNVFTAPENTDFVNPHAVFIGWSLSPDGSTGVFQEGEELDSSVRMEEDGETLKTEIILYAQWEKQNGQIEIKDGKFYITMSPNETATIKNIPAGAQYTIREIKMPAGWNELPLRRVDSVGTIESNAAVSAYFTNEYAPNITKTTLSGRKTFDGDALDVSQSPLVKEKFIFKLYDDTTATEASKDYKDRTPIQTAFADEQGNISFKEMTFNKAGIYRYSVIEEREDIFWSGTLCSEGYDSEKGVVGSAYPNNSNGPAQLIEAPAATEITIDIEYATESVSYDWVAIYSGEVEPTASNYGSLTPIAKFGGAHNTASVTVSGDKAYIFFHSDSSVSDGGYVATWHAESKVSPDIDYDPHIEKIRVEVTDDGNGYLSNQVFYENSETNGIADTDGKIAFDNKSKYASLKLQKKTVEPVEKDTEVLFHIDFATIEDKDVSISIPKGQSSSEVIIDHLPIGETYTITEVIVPDSEYEQESAENDNGTLSSGVNTATFTNRLRPPEPEDPPLSGSFMLQASKSMFGDTIEGGEFSFAVFDTPDAARAAQVSKKTDGARCVSVNAADKRIYFDAIEIDAAGEYRYYIVEIPESDMDTDSRHIDYDTSIIEATVVATDENNDRILECATTYRKIDENGSPVLDDEMSGTGGAGVEDSVDSGIDTDAADDFFADASTLTFNNKVAGGHLRITKKVSGASYTDTNKEFSVRIDIAAVATDSDSKDAVNTAEKEEALYTWRSLDDASKSGAIHSGDTLSIKDGETLEIDIPANATYKIEEVDNTGFVAVYDDNKTGSVKSGETVETAIENIYAPCGSFSLSMSKQAQGFTLINKQFSFALLDEDGRLIATVGNDENGKISFEDIEVSADMLDDTGHGTHTYSVVEIDDSQTSITYDKRECVFSVDMRDKGDGTIACEPKWLWQSGDPQVSFENGAGNSTDNIPAFINSRALSMPFSGQAGTFALIIAGIALVSASIAAIGYRGHNRKGRRSPADKR